MCGWVGVCVCRAAGGEIVNQCVAEKDEAFTEEEVQKLMRQILEGVCFLHRNNVVHLDLKVTHTHTHAPTCTHYILYTHIHTFLHCTHTHTGYTQTIPARTHIVHTHTRL